MTSSMLFGDRRMASSRRSGMTVLGKVPKPINLPSKRLENHGVDPSVEIVPKLENHGVDPSVEIVPNWGSRSSSASNAWGSSTLSPKADGGTSPSYLSGHLSSGSGTRPVTAGSDKGHEPSSNAWGSNSRPSSASGALTSNQTTLTSLRPCSTDTTTGSSQLSKFAEPSDHPVAWSAPGTAEKLCGSSVDHLNLAKSGSKHVDRASEDSALISVIEQKMNQHFGNLLHAVEGLSARISQLETRLRRLENSVDDFKDSTEINHGKADGKLRQLENMLREVDGGMQDLRDKQEITEARLELAKLQMLKGHQLSENQTNSVQTVSAPGVLSSAPQQSYQPHAVQAPTLQVPSLPTDDPPLDTRLRRLENSVDDLKDSTEVNHGEADGKLRQLENMLREVDGGMQDLRDKQEITEARLELAKLQMLEGYQQLENQTNNVQTVSAPGVLSSLPQQSDQPHAVQAPTLQVSTLPTDDPRTLPRQNFPPAQVPTQSPQSEIPFIQYADCNYSPPVQNPQPTPQMYYSFQVLQSQPPPTAAYYLSPPAPHPSLTSQLQQLPQQHPPFNAVDPQAQFSLVHNPGETSMPSQRYPPSFHNTSNAPGLALPTHQQQQYAGSIQYTHDQTASNQYPEFSPGHMQPVQHSYLDDFRSHSGSQSHNSGPNMKHSQVLPASLDCSGGSSFSKLPTAKVLPHAVPMAASVDKESSSSGTGNRIPIDSVIDKVVAMGFRRDMVRATVRKMTENGQSADVNLVLDKLMNNGELPQSGGFGR